MSVPRPFSLFRLAVLAAVAPLASSFAQDKATTAVPVSAAPDKNLAAADSTVKKRLAVDVTACSAGNVTVISAADIASSNAQTIPDLLKYCESVYVTDRSGVGRMTTVDVRGFGQTAGANTLVLVDGFPVNPAAQGYVDLTGIPIASVERIEVMRGGNSVLYGDNAVGGVINIVTQHAPKVGDTVSGETTFGSYGYFRQALGVSGSHGPLSYSTLASYSDSDGYRDNSYLRNKTAGLSLAYDDGGWASVDFAAGSKRDRFGMPGAISADQDRRSAATPRNYGETDDDFIRVTPKLKLSDDSELDFGLGIRQTENRAWWLDYGSTIPNTFAIQELTLQPKYIQRADIANHNNEFTAGVDFRLYKAGQGLCQC